MTLQGYYNRFDAADQYDELLFRASKGLQSAELNEVQSTVIDRVKRIADTIYREGAVVRGTPPAINATTGATSCPASAIYLKGAIREIPERSFTIPVVGRVLIGIFLVETEITELQDATLRDPAPNTRNYNEPGAGRLQVVGTWGHDGENRPGTFYQVYEVIDGVLVTPGQVVNDVFGDLLARYDRESNGNYIVTGLDVVALGLSSGSNAYTVRSGTGNIYGYKLDKIASTRLTYTEDPDIELVDAEPDVFSGTTGGTAAVQTNRFPLSEIVEVVVTKQKTVSLTRGGFTGGQDTLPDVSVLSIQSITQGGTTYTPTTDYFLNGDKVDWSPAGTEPAPGSTYSITYRYLTNVTPENVDLQAGTFNVTGAVNGTLVLTDYRWKLPRYDRICMNRSGEFVRLKGVSSRFNILPPSVPNTLLLLATVENDWGNTPRVANDGIKAIPFDQLERMRSLVIDLFDLVAIERLRFDVSDREPTTKRGVFVDPFLDDDMRDQGLAQTAAVFGGELTLPIDATAYRPATNNAQDWMLPYTEEVVLEQVKATGFSKINPYQSFEPIPIVVTLQPAIDRWVETQTNWLSPVTQTFDSFNGTITSTTSSTRDELVAQTTTTLQFLRRITIEFTLDGLDPGETLTEVLFDGINVTPP